MSTPQDTPANAGQVLAQTGRRLIVPKIAIVAAGMLVIAGYWLWKDASPFEATDNAYVKSDLTFVAPKVAGYVVAVETENNRKVAPGQTLLRIDPTDYLSAVRDAEAAVSQQTAALVQLDAQEALQRAQIKVVDTGVVSADATRQRNAADLARASALIDKGAISRQLYDQTQAEDVRARAGLAQTRAQVDYARTQMQVLAAQRQTIQAQLQSAQAKLTRARNDLAWTQIKAPREGVVAARNVRLGEYVTAGTRLMAIAPTRGLWIEANLRETQLARIAPGDRVEIKVDALPGPPLCGTVESLAGASGSELSVIPADNATGNFTKIVRRFPVRILFDAGQPNMERLGAGMSAEPKILVGSHGGQGAPLTGFRCARKAG